MNNPFRIQRETFESIMDEMPIMFARQYDEVILDKDGLKDDVDYDRYIALERLGVLHCLTVRDRDKLIGYFFNMVVPHLHHKGLIASSSDMIYIIPRYRKGTGLGLKLLTCGIEEMRKLGVKKIYVSAKVDTGLNKVLEFKKFRHIENGYSLWIGD